MRSGRAVQIRFAAAILLGLSAFVAVSYPAAAMPPAVGGLTSPTDPDASRWYPSRNADFVWTALPGVTGYSFVFDQNPGTEPDTTADQSGVSYQSAGAFAVGPWCSGVAVADYDEDGHPDLAVSNSDAAYVSVLLGKGDGTFGRKTNFQTGEDPWSVATADFNIDGHADLVTANSGTTTVSVLLGKGDGTFQTRQELTTGEVWTVVVADMNGDSAPDLVASGDDNGFVNVLLGDGTGGFTRRVYKLGIMSDGLTTADFNRDGKIDVVTANIDANGLNLLLGDGSGGFSSRTPLATGKGPAAVVARDLDGDGDADLASADCDANTVSVLLGDGAGAFSARQSYRCGVGPNSIAAADLDGDGGEDLITSNPFADSVSVLAGDGAGGFGARRDYAAVSPFPAVPSDVNADGVPDIIVANVSDETTTVLLGKTPAANERATADGTWYFHVRAVDDANEGGETATASVMVDTRRPTTRARAATVVRGRTARLRCAVLDSEPCAGWARVEIAVRSAGKTVRTLRFPRRHLGWFTATFRCTLAKGTYHYYVYAADAAGNRQSSLGMNRLVVK